MDFDRHRYHMCATNYLIISFYQHFAGKGCSRSNLHQTWMAISTEVNWKAYIPIAYHTMTVPIHLLAARLNTESWNISSSDLKSDLAMVKWKLSDQQNTVTLILVYLHTLIMWPFRNIWLVLVITWQFLNIWLARLFDQEYMYLDLPDTWMIIYMSCLLEGYRKRAQWFLNSSLLCHIFNNTWQCQICYTVLFTVCFMGFIWKKIKIYL